LLYLRARYYLPGLGVFPSLDPVEEGNRYGYVGRNVVNRVDPSGKCYFNSEETTSEERLICWETWQNYTRLIEQEWGPLSSWQALSNQVDCEGRFWGQFTFSDFTALWNDPNFVPPCGGAQQPFVGAFIGVQPVHTVGADPASALLFFLAGLCVSNAASIIEKLRLPSSSIYSGVVLPVRPSVAQFPARGNQRNEYNDLAEIEARRLNLDPCDVLKRWYEEARKAKDNVAAQKIKTAQKVFDCREHRGN